MKKILFGIFMILTSITFSSDDISYELRDIASDTSFIRFKYFKYDEKKVVAVVSKDPSDFAKKIQAQTQDKNKEITEIWHSFNEEKQEYTAIIYYYLKK